VKGRNSSGGTAWLFSVVIRIASSARRGLTPGSVGACRRMLQPAGPLVSLCRVPKSCEFKFGRSICGSQARQVDAAGHRFAAGAARPSAP
jgi:hypothetical protein